MLKKQSRINIKFDAAEVDGVFLVMLNLKEGGRYYLSEFSRDSRFGYFGIPNMQRQASAPTLGKFIFKPGVDSALAYATLEEALLVVSLVETIYGLEGFDRNILKIDSINPVRIV